MEQFRATGDNPFPRFGHTITYLCQNKIVLYGGATGDVGKYTVKGDVFVFDQRNGKWKLIQTKGLNIPQNRAAHAVTALDQNQLVMYGGAIGSGGLTKDDLYLLSFNEQDDTASWMIINVSGPTPQRRYGHSINYMRPYLVVFGGNNGQENLNDTWILNLEREYLNWHKLNFSDTPIARVYHTGDICPHGNANGMLVIFGGRSQEQKPLNDVWGLRRHRNGNWDWVRSPSKQDVPECRYQHSCLFIGPLMIIIGGRTNVVGQSISLEILDLDTSIWYRFPAVQRFRHVSWNLDNTLYIHGGFDQDSPNVPTDVILKYNIPKLLESASDLAQSFNYFISSQIYKQPPELSQIKNRTIEKQQSQSNKMIIETSPQTQNHVRLSNLALLTHYNNNQQNQKVQLVDINKLHDESKKLRGNNTQTIDYKQDALNNSLIYDYFINTLLVKEFDAKIIFNLKIELIQKLCELAEQQFLSDPNIIYLRTPLKIFGNINANYSDLITLFQHFGVPNETDHDGDIDHLNYLFLGNIFDDVQGDYVDKGNYNLETVCLLFALKLKFPEQFFLLRGHHEDKNINIQQDVGLGDELFQKFGEDSSSSQSIFQRINRVFNSLPFAAVVGDKFFCVHGGIGENVSNLNEINMIKRPFNINITENTKEQMIVRELLWSDPVLDINDSPDNLLRNNILNLKRYSMDTIDTFLINNKLKMIIRSHESVIDGFENMGNKLMTIFSTTNYGGKNNNAMCLLFIKKNGDIVPKVIKSNMVHNKQWNLYGASVTPPRKKNNIIQD